MLLAGKNFPCRTCQQGNSREGKRGTTGPRAHPAPPHTLRSCSQDGEVQGLARCLATHGDSTLIFHGNVLAKVRINGRERYIDFDRTNQIIFQKWIDEVRELQALYYCTTAFDSFYF
jgi:hypothetical protein